MYKYSDFIKESNNQSYFHLFLDEYDKPYKLYFTTYPKTDFSKDKTVSNIKPASVRKYSSNIGIICLDSEERSEHDFAPTRDVVMPTLESAISKFLDSFEVEYIPELYLLENEEFIYLDFSIEELGHNSPDLDGIDNTITLRDNAELIYPILIKYLKIRNIDCELKFINKAKDFQKTDLYKSLNIGNKFNLFESKTETYKYLIFHSHTETEDDYISFSNDRTEVSEVSEFSEIIESIILELERPIKEGEEIYLQVSYIDDTVRVYPSYDKLDCVIDFIEQYDYLMRNFLEKDSYSLDPSEIIGRVAKIKCSNTDLLHVKHAITINNFFKYQVNCPISKLTDSLTMYSFDDETVFKALKTVCIETIQNISWNDNNFEKKHDILKTVNIVKKFKI